MFTDFSSTRNAYESAYRALRTLRNMDEASTALLINRPKLAQALRKQEEEMRNLITHLFIEAGCLNILMKASDSLFRLKLTLQESSIKPFWINKLRWNAVQKQRETRNAEAKLAANHN